MPTNIVIAIDDTSNIDGWGLRPKSPVAWSPDNYAKGTVVTYSGQVWLAQAQTSGTPGISTDWESLIPSMTGAAGADFSQGAWNAATNSPTLVSSVGTEGYYYRVSTSGSTSLDGVSTWIAGDWVYFQGGAWRRAAVSPTAGFMVGTNNLSDVASAATSRTNLGLGTAAVQNVTAFNQTANNLSDVASVPTARTNLVISPNSGVRQTVIAGPVDTSGLPTLLPATTAGLSIATQNVSSSAPFIVSAAQAFNEYGAVDAVTMFTSNQTWSSLTASSTLYLYINASSGALGFTSVVPIYQFGGTPSTTNGQFTFNIAEMKGYMGNGSTAPATPLVFVGEVVTNGSTVTSSVSYAYNGRYDSGWTNTLPGTATVVSKNHNIGIAEISACLLIKCLTAEQNFSAGDIMLGPSIVPAAGQNAQPQFIVNGRNATQFVTGATAAIAIINKTTGAAVTPTAANWAYRITAIRAIGGVIW